MLQLNQKSWNDSKKLAARQATIIGYYRDCFGCAIPADTQYWSMCGQCVAPTGEFQVGCELDQITKEGLIQPAQFHGVEINPEITEANRNGCPQAHWYCDDFYLSMLKAKAQNKFTPAIVNADFINMPVRACGYFSDILALLSVCKGGIMLVGNMVMEFQRFPHRNRDAEFILQKLNKQPQFQFALKTADWRFDQKYYRYAGTGKESRTTMGSIIFWKEK